MPFSPRRLAGAAARALMLMALLLPGCGRKKGEAEGAADRAPAPLARPHPAPTRPETPPAWTDAEQNLTLSGVETSRDGVRVSVRIAAGGARPRSSAGFNFVIPDDRPATVTLTRLAFDGEPTTITPTLESSLRLEPAGNFREWKLGRLRLMPGLWNGMPAAAVEADIEIEWLGEPLTAAPAAFEAKRPMERVAAAIVANPEDLGRFAAERAPLREGMMPAADPRALAPGGERWLKITVEAEGLYRIDPAALREAGIAAPLAELRVFSRQQAVPALIVAEGDARAEAGLYFYARAGDGPFSPGRAYTLTAAPATPPAPWPVPAVADAPPRPIGNEFERTFAHDPAAKLILEQDELLSIRGLHWVDRPLLSGEPLAVPLELHAPRLDDLTTVAARLTFYPEAPSPFWNETRIEGSIGGQPAGSFTLTGSAREQELAIPAGLLGEGMTTLTLTVATPTSATLPDAPARLWLDRVEITYPAHPTLVDGRFEQTVAPDAAGSAPLRVALQGVPPGAGGRLIAFATTPTTETLVAARAAAPGLFDFPPMARATLRVVDLASAAPAKLEPVSWRDDLLRADRPVQYLIISHPDFIDTLGPLLALNRERGLETKVADVTALYDHFGHGTLTPEAIRAYLGHASANWPGGAPDYVLLVGDATSDYLGQLREDVTNYVPSYTWREGLESWASDSWFGMINGEDFLPDLAVARLPVTNVADLKAMLAKIDGYARSARLGPWRARLAYVADDTEPLQPFKPSAEALRTEDTPAAFGAERTYLEDLPLEDNWYVPEDYIESVLAEENRLLKVSAATTAAIKRTFDEGAAWLDYFGHGSPNIWCDERIWFGGDSVNRDTLHLADSGGRLPFIANWTCNTGAIDYPRPPWNINISEDLLRTPDAGAIGLFVPSGPGTTPVHRRLAGHLRQALFVDNLRVIGEATQVARLRFGLEDAPTDMMTMYVLLGDPALPLQLTPRWQPLELDAKGLNPDLARTVEGKAAGVVPDEGRARAWLETAEGAVMWEGAEFGYDGGLAAVEVPLPEGLATPGRLRLALYGWNEAAQADWAAAGWVELARPAPRVLSAAASGAEVAVTLSNPAAAAAGPFELRVERLAGERAETLARETATLAAATTRTLNLALTGAARPDWLQVAIDPAGEVDDVGSPEVSRHPLAVLPEGFVGLSAAHSVVEQEAGGARRVRGVAWSAAPAEAMRLGLLGEADDVLTSAPLEFGAVGAAFMAEGVLPVADGGRRLALLDASGAAVDAVGLDGLAVRSARLRLDAQSVRFSPETPVDGETVYVTARVENAGELAAAPATLRLLDNEPGAGGRPLPRYGEDRPQAETAVPALGAGRATTVTLRWDPVRNAGVRKLWLHLALPGVDAATTPTDSNLLLSRQIFVRTRWQLARGPIGVLRRTPEDVAANRYRIQAEVLNSGDTDATGVEVTFFSGPEHTEEQRMGRVELERVPARGSARAILVWTLPAGLRVEDVRPSVEIRLLGSSQRVSG